MSGSDFWVRVHAILLRIEEIKGVIQYGCIQKVNSLPLILDPSSAATVHDRFPIRDGASILRIAERGRRASLEGEYWTNRDTTGDIQLWFWSRALLDEWPVSGSMAVLSKRRKDSDPSAVRTASGQASGEWQKRSD